MFFYFFHAGVLVYDILLILRSNTSLNTDGHWPPTFHNDSLKSRLNHSRNTFSITNWYLNLKVVCRLFYFQVLKTCTWVSTGTCYKYCLNILCLLSCRIDFWLSERLTSILIDDFKIILVTIIIGSYFR